MSKPDYKRLIWSWSNRLKSYASATLKFLLLKATFRTCPYAIERKKFLLYVLSCRKNLSLRYRYRTVHGWCPIIFKDFLEKWISNDYSGSTFIFFEPASLTQDCTAVGLNEVSMCSTIMNPDESMNMSKIDETVNSTAVG